MRSDAEIQQTLRLAEELDVLPDQVWPLRYQDGVASALRWMLGEGRGPLTPMEPMIAPRLVDIRHRLPEGGREDLEALRDLPPGGYTVSRIPWLKSWLERSVPDTIIRHVFSLGPLQLDDRLGQHIICFGDDGNWFPWHTHGFTDSFLSFVLFPFDRDEDEGGLLRLSTGETITPKAGHAAIFDGRATAHCVTPLTKGAPRRIAITAFYRDA